MRLPNTSKYMGTLENLTPFNTLPPERRREIAVMGGKASGAARRARRAEINRIKAEQAAAKELAGDELYMLCQAVHTLYLAAKESGVIEPQERHRDGYRWMKTGR